MTPRAELVRVGDVLRLERRAVEIDPLRDYTLIGVYSFGKGIFHRDPQPGSEIGNYRFFEIHPGDLVLSNIQAWEAAIGFATERDAGTIGTHRFLTYVPVDDRVDANWARYFFLSDAGFPLIQRAAPGSVTRNRTLAIDRFEALEIPMPPIDEQRRIAGVLEGTAGRINLLRATYERFGALAKHVVATSTLIGGTHPGSRTVLLGEVLSPVRDSVRVEPDRDYPNVGILSFARGLFEKPPVEGSRTSASTLFRIRAGQFIYSRLFAFEGAYAIVDERFDGHFVSNEFPVFDIDEEKLDARYLLSYLSSPRIWEELATGSVGLGVRRQRVKPEVLLTHQIRLPPLTEQKRIGTIAQKARRIEARRSHALALTDAIGLAMLNQTFPALR